VGRALDRALGREDDRAFDAAARDGALEAAVPGHGEQAAGRTRRRAPGADDGRERRGLAGVAPADELLEDVDLGVPPRSGVGGRGRVGGAVSFRHGRIV
jgi:hypothetical protein